MRIVAAGMLALASACAGAAEVTVKNDSLTDFGTAAIVWGFVEGEKAASWLTSPCNGTLRAVQIFWRSPIGTSGQTIHDSIEIFRSGTFPTPGALVETIAGPVLADGALNEWRYVDENNLVPLAVDVAENETLVVSFTFDHEPEQLVAPSVVRDSDGVQPNRNGLYAMLAPGTYMWFNSASLGVAGDWVIRAVIDCAVVDPEADVAVDMTADAEGYTPGQPLTYTVVVDNAGPAAATSTTIVDVFPAAFTSPAWTCTPSGGATCPASGSGNITHVISLPAGGSATYEITGTVSASASGTLSNSFSAVVGGIIDPEPSNNTVTLELEELLDDDTVFANGFEDG